MLVLLDEQLPRQLAQHLVGHVVRTVQQESWAGLKNGALLIRAEAAGFSVLVTGDQNLEPIVGKGPGSEDRVRPGQVIRVTA